MGTQLRSKDHRRRTWLAIAAAGIMATLVAGSPVARASFPGSNGRLAFSDTGGVVTVEPDGTGEVEVTPSPGRDLDPVWSPDGTKLAWLSDRGLAGGSLVVAGADGSNAQTLVEESVHEVGSWSPDGQQILVYMATRTPAGDFVDRGLKIVSVGDGSIVPIPGTANMFDAVWSPTGPEIAAFESPDGLAEMLVGFAPDGSGKRTIIDLGTGTASPSGLDWAPDGMRLAFGSVANACSGRIAVVHRNGSGFRTIPVSGTCNETDPAWSPDGQLIAFVGEGMIEPGGIYVMSAADGSGLTFVRGGDNLFGVDWQPIQPGPLEPILGDLCDALPPEVCRLL